MKKRKINNAFFVLLILFISIGFAYLSANLNIISNITFLPQSFNVYFENLQVNPDSSNLDNPTLGNNDTSVSFISTINEPGDFYEFSFDVVNAGTMDAALNEIIKNGLTATQEEYLDYTARYYGNREINEDDILHGGYKEKIIVRVEYKYDIDNVPSLGNVSFSFGLNYIKRDLQKDYGEEVWSIEYTGTQRTFTVSKNGLYKLETWGAQGGDADIKYNDQPAYATGGYGGYSVGTISLVKNNNLYLNIGGLGGSCFEGINCSALENAYNGGGPASINSNTTWAGSGGATHIAFDSGLLTTFSDKTNKLIIVSGGGGGAGSFGGYANNGGNGGGYIGVNGNNTSHPEENVSTGGTQSAGGTGSSGSTSGAFGRGSTGCASGGGGYYGGGGGCWWGASGAGGSGYIGNTNLTEKIMYCYNCQSSINESDETHIKTRSTTNVSEEPISNYAKIGSGFARISFIG